MALSAVNVSELDVSDTITATLSVADGTLSVGAQTGVIENGVGTDVLSLTGTATAIDSALAGLSYAPANGFTGTDTLSFTAGDGALASNSATLNIDVAPPADSQYTYVTDFSKSNNIQNALISQFPSGVFTAANALATPFDITTNNHGNNFYDGFTHGSTLTINVAIPDATNVYTLINAYAPQNGFEIATVEFVGSNGATETFDLVNGTNVRDFYQGGFANSINGTTTENAFTVTNTVGGAATGNSSDGEFGTYNIDEQNFMLSGAFASQTLTKIIITDLGFQAGGSDVPIVLGVTAQSAEPVDHWVGGSADWSTAGDWSFGAAPTSIDDAVVDASGTYTVDISASDAVAATSLVINAGGATVTDEGSLTLSGALTVNAGTFDLDGGTLSAASIAVASGAELEGYGTISSPVNNAGNVTATLGTLDLSGAVTGTGSTTIDGGAVLDFAAGATPSQITFDNGHGPTTYGAILFGSQVDFSATVNDFTGTGAGSPSSSDVIAFAGNWTEQSDTPSGNNQVLVLAQGNSTVTLTFVDFNGTLIVHAPGDNGQNGYNGYTIVTDPPSADSSTPSGPSVSIGGAGNDSFVFHPGMGAEPTSYFRAPTDALALGSISSVHTTPLAQSVFAADGQAGDSIDLGHHDVAGQIGAQWHAHLVSLAHLH